MTTNTAVDISCLNPGDEVMVKGRFDLTGKGLPVVRFVEGSVRLKAADIVAVEPAATEKKLQLEVGKYYRNRLGEKRGPMYFRQPYTYPWTDNSRSYLTDGRFYESGEADDRDLVAEWIEPKAEPEAKNPFKVGDRVRYNTNNNNRGDFAGVVAALGSQYGIGTKANAITYENGGWDYVSELELMPPEETNNPFKVGDRVQYKDTPDNAHMQRKQFTVTAHGNRLGRELATGVVFDNGGWEQVAHLELVPAAPKNPFKVGDRVRHKAARPNRKEYVVAALGFQGRSIDTTVTYDNGGWDSVSSIELVPIPTVDTVVEEVRADLLRRSQIGIAKYGTTLDRTDLGLKDWLVHTYEEVLDSANYLKRAILELDQQVAK